ncbi:NAD(+) diphosphatase [Alkalicaulis satelles]|uniref:NAD(+) diphosphatase n=1 Tax=Alkalicaulis satelles TaxID=2609175 RepID=A0A5M6ZM23_9PROT|nr:NAD(+) diphosphatase [Alkalicaulis satelles]KAA5804794.1 NAD(+) diphosphatase [Alkalicaulis satelles]
MQLTFTDSPLDHAGLMRGDPAWIQAQHDHPGARAVLFAGGSLALDAQGGPLVLPVGEAGRLPLKWPGLVFLGLENGAPWFAASLEPGVAERGPDFRMSAMQAPPELACIFGRARAILLWLARRKVCSNCGGSNEPADGGLRLVCPSCGMEHYPRTDPSVILLPYAGDKCVLGRQPSWPPGMYATLAGFVEPGETLEAACARETMEEVHLKVLSADYVASQPWPFPSSLMLGFMAEVEPGEVRPDDDLEDARWFTRDEVRALLDTEMGRWIPPHFSISRLLIERWLNGP